MTWEDSQREQRKEENVGPAELHAQGVMQVRASEGGCVWGEDMEGQWLLTLSAMQ